MNLLKRLAYVFDRKQKTQLMGLFIIILIGTFIELLGVTSIMPLLDIMIAPETIESNPTYYAIYRTFGFTDWNQFIAMLVGAIIVVYIVKNVYVSWMYFMQYRWTFRNQAKIATRMLDSYLHQPYYFHVTHNSAELIRNVNSDTVMMFNGILSVIQLATEVCVCLVLGIFLLIMDKSITIGVLLFLSIFLLVFVKGFKSYLSNIGTKDRKYNADILKWLQQSFGGIKEAKILGRETFFFNQFKDSYDKYAFCEEKYRFLQVAPRPIMEAVCISALLLVVLLKLLNGTTSDYFITTIGVFAVAAFRLLPSINRITNYLSVILFNKSAINAVYEDLKEIEDLQKTYLKQETTQEKIIVNEKISVQNLTFTYPEMNYNVLDNVNLEIGCNQSVAFIGPSGAGKTTLADVILGALNPISGHVYADDHDIFQNLSAWHKAIGYIPQSIYLMDDTIRNNIAFGIPGEEISDDNIWKALEQAQLKEYVESLELGLDTEIGEGGIRLSGGQRQRIGIARALYNDPSVLVLDEATSALDNETEAAVMEAIDRLAGSKTLIIIAHRLTTIQNCDVVYEIKDGQAKMVDKPVL